MMWWLCFPQKWSNEYKKTSFLNVRLHENGQMSELKMGGVSL